MTKLHQAERTPEGSSVPGDSVPPHPSPPPPKPADEQPGVCSPPATPALSPAPRCPAVPCHWRAALQRHPHNSQPNSQASIPRHPTASVCQQLLHKLFGERELKRTPSKDSPVRMALGFPVTQRVVAMPQFCQRCQQQQLKAENVCLIALTAPSVRLCLICQTAPAMDLDQPRVSPTTHSILSICSTDRARPHISPMSGTRSPTQGDGDHGGR